MIRPHRGSRALRRLVEHAPATGGLSLWLRHEDLPAEADDGVRRLVVDGERIAYGRAFEALALPLQTGLVAHAVLHVALRHGPRALALRARGIEPDLALWNVCADAIVDAALAPLGWLALPDDAVALDRLLAAALAHPTTPEAALREWDVERLYLAIDDRRAAGAAVQSSGTDARRARPREDGPRAAAARAFAHPARADLQPDPQAAAAPEAEAQQAREWRERLLRGHAEDGEFSLLRGLVADLGGSGVPWELLLRAQLARALAPQREPSWSRPSRSALANRHRRRSGLRAPVEPGWTASRRVPRLALVVDVSGSVDDRLLARFAAEVEAIARRCGSAVTLLVGDNRVRERVDFEPGRCTLRDRRFHGGGGTDFTPLLQAAEAARADLALVLTDLQGPARHRPRCPVLWAVPRPLADGLQPPFGRLLALD